MELLAMPGGDKCGGVVDADHFHAFKTSLQRHTRF